MGAFLGLFAFVRFLNSPLGIPHVLGEHGSAKQVGQAIQVIGVLTALIAAVLATRANYRIVDWEAGDGGRAWRPPQ